MSPLVIRAARPIRLLSIVILLASLSVPATADAQRRRGDPPNREQIEQRIRAQMGRMMQERLGLDAAEAERLSEVVTSFDSQRRELFEQEIATRRQVEALMDGDGDEDEARALLEQQAELRMQEAQLFRAEQEALLEVLTAAQVLELQDLRQDIGRRIRALRGAGGSDRGRFRGPGPGADGDGRMGAYPPPRGLPPLL